MAIHGLFQLFDEAEEGRAAGAEEGMDAAGAAARLCGLRSVP